jgi:hypothetical protein
MPLYHRRALTKDGDVSAVSGTAPIMRNVRVTKLGVAFLAVLATAIVVSLWASGPIKGVGVAVIALLVLMLAGEGLSRGGPINSEASRKREVLSRDAKRRFDRGP